MGMKPLKYFSPVLESESVRLFSVTRKYFNCIAFKDFYNSCNSSFLS